MTTTQNLRPRLTLGISLALAAIAFLIASASASASGPALIGDVVPIGGGSWPGPLTNVGGTLFFGAADDIHGGELWRSDGTAAGTKLVRDIVPVGGSEPGSPHNA